MANWHHAPLHYVQEAGTYSVTGSTLYKQLFFRSRKRLDLLHDAFFGFASQPGWLPQAWSFFPNHYHFVASCQRSPTQLSLFLNELHSMTARELNAMDGVEGRVVWCQFWDTQITSQGSYLARLRYVHENAVHHRVVTDAEAYKWCSAAWFARNARPSFYRAVTAMKIDRVKIRDDFQW